MVEPLKKDDIIIGARIYDIIENATMNEPYEKEYVEVLRIKELLKDVLSFAVVTNDKIELQCKILNTFGVLFNTQSPNQCKPSREAVKDNPPQVIQHESQPAEKSVGVSSPKKCKAFGGMRSQNRGGRI